MIMKTVLRNTNLCIVCSEKDKKEMIQFFFEKHNACIICSEKMVMECKHVSTLEHEVKW